MVLSNILRLSLAQIVAILRKLSCKENRLIIWCCCHWKFRLLGYLRKLVSVASETSKYLASPCTRATRREAIIEDHICWMTVTPHSMKSRFLMIRTRFYEAITSPFIFCLEEGVSQVQGWVRNVLRQVSFLLIEEDICWGLFWTESFLDIIGRALLEHFGPDK